MKHGSPISPMNPSNNRWNVFTHNLSCWSQSQTNYIKVQDNGNSVLGQMEYLAGRLNGKRNDDKLRCLMYNFKEPSKSNSKLKAHVPKRNFVPSRQCQASNFDKTWDYIEFFGWDVLDHTPYSPKPDPSDLHLFWHLQHHLVEKLSSDYENALNSWLSEQATDVFKEAF